MHTSAMSGAIDEHIATPSTSRQKRPFNGNAVVFTTHSLSFFIRLLFGSLNSSFERKTETKIRSMIKSTGISVKWLVTWNDVIIFPHEDLSWSKDRNITVSLTQVSWWRSSDYESDSHLAQMYLKLPTDDEIGRKGLSGLRILGRPYTVGV